MDSEGNERRRIEGYLPKTDFQAQLELGLARVDFMHKQWAAAKDKYTRVAELYPETIAAPEAIYWRGVSHYKATNDHTVLTPVAEDLGNKYPGSEWELKASVWAH